jgi:hypothetical protein
MGSSSAVVPVTPNVASPIPYTVTAMLGGSMATASVRVLGTTEAPMLVAIDPDSARVLAGGTVRLSVLLDRPAPPGGTVVDLAATAGGTVPASVTVPGDQMRANFDFTAGGAEAVVTVTARLGTERVTATVTVTEAPPRELLLNEVDYDQPGADTTEFVEIFNPGDTPRALDGLAVVFFNGAMTPAASYLTVNLSGTIDAGGYAVVANDAVVTPAGVPRFRIANSTVQNGDPDGLALVEVATGRVLDVLSYGGGITRATYMGREISLVSGRPTTARDVSSGPASLARLPNGVDTDDDASDWARTETPTPGAENL